jgi:hypothetical protein
MLASRAGAALCRAARVTSHARLHAPPQLLLRAPTKTARATASSSASPPSHAMAAPVHMATFELMLLGDTMLGRLVRALSRSDDALLHVAHTSIIRPFIPAGG